MKFTLGWLRDHLDTDATLDEITEKLTDIGLELEGVVDRGAVYAPFFVAAVEKAERHPDADRLQVLTVDTGREKMQVVCGAPNARAGMKGIFAPEGSTIPGSGTVLKKGVIRGVESCGMMVSEREMALSDEHEGIIEVDPDIAIGTPFAELYRLNDPVIEVAVTPNRADCAGVRGIARDLAAAGLGTLVPIDDHIAPVKGQYKSPINVTLDFDEHNADACPLFLGRMMRGVKNGPSPQWMQDRLKAIGLRPISALVDITNYLSYDLCRPLHVFDADKLQGDLHVRLAKKGEELAALNEKTYILDDFMTVVADLSGAQALGGVIGGEHSGCVDDTVNVFIECAWFDPYRTAKTGRALSIESDARYRFERGIDPAFTVDAIEIATRLIRDLCGGEASDVVTAGAVPAWQRTIVYDPDLIRKLAGFDIGDGTQKQILQSLGFVVTADDEWQVQPPPWRADIEGAADLVEEIVRIYGYDKIPAVSMRREGAIGAGAETLSMNRARTARTALAARGMNECVTWSFMPAERAALFGANENRAAVQLRLQNPISSELDYMRPSIIGNLIDAAGKNRDKGFGDTALFEVGPVFRSQKTDGQALVAAGIRSGAKGPRHWSGAEASRPIDLFDVKADVLAALAACGGPADNAQVSRDAPGYYHPGRSGCLRLGTNVLACFGEIHPSVLEAMDVKGPMVGFEIWLDAIPQPKKKPGPARPLLALAPLQPVRRDFAFIVDQGVEAEQVIRAARGADKALIEGIEVFDIYTGKGVEDGKKSVAITVTLQPRNQTLTDADLEAVSDKIVNQVIARTGGQLRA